MAQTAISAFLVIWIAGKDFKTAPEGVERTVALKEPASGGGGLYGGCLDKKGSVVTYEFDLPADVKDARIIFRYARLHWKETMKPAAVELAVDAGAGAGAEVKKEIAFAGTGGWGDMARDFQLLAVELGDLKKGKHSLKLTSLAGDNSVTIDGFFVASKDFKITDEELNRCCRIQIRSEGYVGLARPTTLIRQDSEKSLEIASRFFDGAGPMKCTGNLWRGESRADEAALKDTGLGKGDIQELAIPEKQPDGVFNLHVVPLNKAPFATQKFTVVFCGDLMSSFSRRLKPLRDLTADLANKTGEANAASSPLLDLQHITAYLAANYAKLGGAADANQENALKKGLAALEGVQDPDALIGDMHKAMEQAEAMIKNIQAGKDAYEGLRGDIRRAYRSAGDGSMVPYRVFIPDAYAKAEKVPFIYMLHGGGGDEDFWSDTEGGKILEVLNKRGYLAVMPKWNTRGRPGGDVLQLLELAMKEYPKIDANRVYCTGLSMGGFGTYRLATEHPEFFAAVCCVSGTGDAAKADKLKNVPLLIIQGGDDTVVPPAGAERVVARMKELGYPVVYHLIPANGHSYHAEEYLNLTLDFFDGKTKGNRQ